MSWKETHKFQIRENRCLARKIRNRMKGKGEQRALPSLASLCKVGAGEVRPRPTLWFP